MYLDSRPARILRVARKWKLVSDVPEVGLLKARKTDFDFLTFEEAEAFIVAAKQVIAALTFA